MGLNNKTFFFFFKLARRANLHKHPYTLYSSLRVILLSYLAGITVDL